MFNNNVINEISNTISYNNCNIFDKNLDNGNKYISSNSNIFSNITNEVHTDNVFTQNLFNARKNIELNNNNMLNNNSNL